MAFGIGTNSNGVPADMHPGDVPLRSLLGRKIQQSNALAATPTPDLLNVTLGLELEFILAVSTYPDKASHENEDEAWAQTIVRYALSQPMVAKCAKCGTEHAFHLKVHPTSQSDYEHWTVEEDNSLMIVNDEMKTLGENKEYFHFYAIEVKSRILRPGMNFETTPGDRGTGHVHEITYVEEIDSVLSRLHDFFTGATCGHKIDRTRIVLNSTSGLHIHVGNERRGFPLPTVKNILGTYVANERAIDGLHAASRISGCRIATEALDKPFHDRSVNDLHLLPLAFNTSWSTQFAQTAHTLKRQRFGYNTRKSCLPRPSDQPAFCYPETHMNESSVGNAVDSFYVGDWLEVIDHAPSLQAIQQLQMLSLGRGTLNLRNLAPHDSDDEKDEEFRFWGDQMMTIEFRQHAGSLDAAEIHAWMDVVVSIVTHAHYTPDADYKALSRTQWLQPDYGSIDLLKEICCSLDTKRFYRHKLSSVPTAPNEGVFAADIAEIDLFPTDAMIAPLLEYVEWKRRQDYHPGNVADRIKEKFRMGGYGKFHDEYLNQLGGFNLYDPYLGLRDKLSIDRES